MLSEIKFKRAHAHAKRLDLVELWRLLRVIRYAMIIRVAITGATVHCWFQCALIITITTKMMIIAKELKINDSSHSNNKKL